MPIQDKSKKKDDFNEVNQSKLQSSVKTEIPKDLSIQPHSKKITLTETPQFDAWVKSLLFEKKNSIDLRLPKENSKDELMPTLNLGRFGLRTHKDVLIFLHSSAGEAMLSKLEGEIEINKALREGALFQIMIDSFLKLLLKAFFVSSFLNKRSLAAQQLKELILEQNELAIEKAKPKPYTSGTDSTDEAARNEAFRKAMLEYDQAVNDAMSFIAQGEQLDSKMSKLLQEGQQIEDKYDLWEIGLDNFINTKEVIEDFLNPNEIHQRLAVLSKDEEKIVEMANNPKHVLSKGLNKEHQNILNKINALKNILSVQTGIKTFVDAQGKEVDSIDKAELILTKGQKIVEEAGLFYLLNPDQTWESIKNNPRAKASAQERYDLAVSELQAYKIDTRLQKILIKIEEQTDLIQQHIEANRDEEANALKNQLIALNLKYGHLQDVLAVHKGEKQFVNQKGDPVKTFEEAFCIVPKMQPLVSFEKQILEHNGIYYLLNKNQDWDSIKDSPEAQLKARQDFQAEKLESKMTLKCVLGQNKVLEKAFHLERVEAAGKEIENNQTLKQNAENQLQLLQSLIPKLLNPALQPKLSPDAPRPSPSAPIDNPALAKTSLFRNKMKEMTQTPTLTQEDLNNLALHAPGPTRQSALEFIHKNMPRTGNIPQVTMQFLLRNLEQFGVDTTKPAVTTIDKPSKAISPFKITPDPTR